MNLFDKKYKLYIELIKTVQNEAGFIEFSHCDSIGFSSLIGCVPDVKVNIDAAFDKVSGQWHRRPCDKPCFPEHSKSTISRDMILMLLWYAYFNKRLDISEQIIKHALGNFGIMGQAVNFKTKIGRCLISPALLSTAAWVSYRLGGPSRPWLRWLPVSPADHVTGFQAHLTVLHVLLRNKLTNKNSYKEVLESHYKRQPNNPLFALAAGDLNAAEAILADSNLWPDNRLPSNHDRKEPWLLQRDYGPSWQPDSTAAKHKHSGGDFLFCYWLLNSGILT